MEIQTHQQLLHTLQEQFTDRPAQITFTQWEGEEEDETVTEFQAVLKQVSLTEGDFAGKDLFLLFEAEGEQVLELLMEIPAEEEDLGVLDGGQLRIFGTEAELVIE
ncbi:hypothetical protein [Brevibacillus massiliensis]|jgi:hypothetical protein|uniref:hypothetical protein n=1 Tax=Brevibacillus massiliensis TaxID=1118054 RepID=UPI000315D195|nr:hypothetical protein [Brevibacillus massiliensis]